YLLVRQIGREVLLVEDVERITRTGTAARDHGARRIKPLKRPVGRGHQADTGGRIVGQHADPFATDGKHHGKVVAARHAAAAAFQALLERLAQQLPGPVGYVADADRLHFALRWAGATRRGWHVDRLEAAPRQRHAASKRQQAPAWQPARHPATTKLTMRLGTWMRLTIRFPCSPRATFGSLSAMAMTWSAGVSGGTAMVPRSFPITCTAIVTVSAASSAGSASGHASSATNTPAPGCSRAYNSSARCGIM